MAQFVNAVTTQKTQFVAVIKFDKSNNGTVVKDEQTENIA